MSHLKEKVLKPFSWVLRLIMVQLKKCDCSAQNAHSSRQNLLNIRANYQNNEKDEPVEAMQHVLLKDGQDEFLRSKSCLRHLSFDTLCEGELLGEPLRPGRASLFQLLVPFMRTHCDVNC